MKMEDTAETTQDSGSTKTSTAEKIEDKEIAKYFLLKFFKAFPVSEDEKTITNKQSLKIILGFYDKCCELLDKVCGHSKTLEIVRTHCQWKRELNNACSLEDVTYATETLLIEYELAAHDDGKRNKMTDAFNIEKINSKKESKVPSMRKSVYVRSKEVCVEKLIGLYCHADKIGKLLQMKVEGKKNETPKATEEAVSMETDSKLGCEEKEFRSNQSEFVKNFKLLIRASLILFKRLNSEWAESGRKYLDQAEAKKKEFFASKGKGADSQNTASSSNLDIIDQSSNATELYEMDVDTAMDVDA